MSKWMFIGEFPSKTAAQFRYKKLYKVGTEWKAERVPNTDGHYYLFIRPKKAVK